MKTVVIACGSGVATSTIIYGGVESLLKKSGIPYNLVQCSSQNFNLMLDRRI